ncbi:MAG: hypothetical protein LBI62_08570, partial [Candidatus Accumulibacter sp.]|nr:hypothetical protein [Accumulibacter sp.]
MSEGRGIDRSGRYAAGVAHERGKVRHQRLEALVRRTIVEPTTADLGFCCRGALRWRDRVTRGLGGSIRVSERQLSSPASMKATRCARPPSPDHA